MKKTFYSVKYQNIGGYGPMIAWFDDLKKLEEFVAKQDGADKSIRHTYRKPESIKKAQRMVNEREKWKELVELERERREAAILGEREEEDYYNQKIQQILEELDEYSSDEEIRIGKEMPF